MQGPLLGPWGAFTRIARLALLLAFTAWIIWMLYAHPPGMHASC